MTGFHVTRGRANCFDYDRLERMAKRFCINHNLLDKVEPNYRSMKEYIKDNDLYPIWRNCVIRAIGDEDIYQGYIGHFDGGLRRNLNGSR